jgi:hypothetical protein
MRYTLRLLTLDQLSRAAGVVCALELMRGEPEWQDGDKKRLGDWPIEIGLWVGAAATPNRLGGKGNTSPDSAVSRVKRFRRDGREAPAPIKACPWCGEPFSRDSFACEPSDVTPKNMLIRCAGANCPFTGRRALPILTVDEAIYRRLPAFVIATIDKFAGLRWLAGAGAFFGNVKREDQWGFYGAADPAALGRRLFGGASLLPPALIVQDELHLISGPLGTVAALYETVLDGLASRNRDGRTIRPKVVASTATVRRAAAQIEALFDLKQTEVFPPPGPDRRDSFLPRQFRHLRSRRGSMSGSPRRARGRSSSSFACCCRCSLPRRRKRTPSPTPTLTSPRSATSTPCANSAAPAVSSRTKSWCGSRATATNGGASSRLTNRSRTVACERSWSLRRARILTGSPRRRNGWRKTLPTSRASTSRSRPI